MFENKLQVTKECELIADKAMLVQLPYMRKSSSFVNVCNSLQAYCNCYFSSSMVKYMSGCIFSATLCEEDIA